VHPSHSFAAARLRDRNWCSAAFAQGHAKGNGKQDVSLKKRKWTL